MTTTARRGTTSNRYLLFADVGTLIFTAKFNSESQCRALMEKQYGPQDWTKFMWDGDKLTMQFPSDKSKNASWKLFRVAMKAVA
jgi:hypothetical protein